MATISLSDAAPKVDGELGFALGNANFELASGGSFDSDDPAVIGGAVVHPWLKVAFAAPAESDAPDYDPNDPHQNPAADHLGQYASPEVKKAAEEAEAAIQAVAYPNDPNAAAVETKDEADIAKTVPDAPAPSPQTPAPSADPQPAPKATPNSSTDTTTSGASS